MKLDQLLYFVETARVEHIGKAAKRLAISSSAISHAITALEDELGCALFVRTGKNIKLTERGKQAHKRAAKLLEEFNSFKTEITNTELKLGGYYKLAGSHILCSKLLAPVWSELQEQHPELVGELLSLRSGEVVKLVLSGEIDFGLCFSPQRHVDLAINEIHARQLQIVVSRQHPLLKEKQLNHLEILSNYPAVLPKSMPGIDVCERHPLFEECGITSRTIMLFDNYDVAVEKLCSSDAWSFFPDIVTQYFSDRLVSIGPAKHLSAAYKLSGIFLQSRPLMSLSYQLIADLKTRCEMLDLGS